MSYFFRRRRWTLADFFPPDIHPVIERTRYRLPLSWKNHENSRAVTITGDVAENIEDYFDLKKRVTYQICNLYCAGFHTVITGTIEGFDTVVLQSVAALKETKLLPLLRLIVITVDSQYWHYPNDRKWDIRKGADYFVNLSEKMPEADYQERHRWMLGNSSHLLYYSHTDKRRDPVTEDIIHQANMKHIPCGNIYHFALIQNIIKLSRNLGGD